MEWGAGQGWAETKGGSHSLIQGIFLTQGFEPGSPALQMDSLLSMSLRKPIDFPG